MTHNQLYKINTEDWNSINQFKNVYLNLDYLEAIENTLSQSIEFRYLCFYHKNEIVAIAVIQNLRFLDKENKEREEICFIRNTLINTFIPNLETQVMTCGSVFASGENGFAFKDSLAPKEAYKLLANALFDIQKSDSFLKKSPVILIKEFLPNSYRESRELIDFKFREFEVDVNMVMQIDSDWRIFEDYLFALTTKFRTKAKSTFKKSEAIEIKDLSADDLEKYSEELEKLYLNVVEKSNFVFGSLTGKTFVQLKQKLKNQFVVQGFFLDQKLVGFSSAFIYKGILDANYVGINYDLNQEYGLYQRMLYNYIGLAIEKKCHELRFGRTAEEIKSSVGANPVPMKLYIKHSNDLVNKILKSTFKAIKPRTFDLRNPFKAANQIAKSVLLKT